MEQSLVERASDAITKLIIEQDLEPGDKLPNEYELAASLDIGRGTLREAVRALVSRNILEVKQGSGTYVSQNLGVSDDPLGFSLIKDTAKLTEDLFELRYILEPEVALLAAQKRTPKQLERLEDIANQIEETIEQAKHIHIGLDIEFHAKLVKMSGNHAMNHLVPIINQSITLYNTHYTSTQNKQDAINSHREIVEAIRNQNLMQAKYSMQMHIANNQRQLKKRRESLIAWRFEAAEKRL
ncbi:FadR family transcriptional regulator [Aerococcaceae bacterium DSM 111021]|nr:FadR family transcriptional regulator [Aerococcaceae bacterium DSM 111021]